MKAKVAAGKAWVKGKIRGGDDTPEGRQLDIQGFLAAAHELLEGYGQVDIGVAASVEQLAPWARALGNM